MIIVRFICPFIFVLIVLGSAYAFQNEPDGFRGVKWGGDIKNQRDMSLATYQPKDNPDVSLWKKNDDKLMIGDVELKEITYYYYNNKYFKVVIEYKDTQAIRLKSFLYSLYGKSSSQECTSSARTAGVERKASDNYYWKGKKVNIALIHMTALSDSWFVNVPEGCYPNTIGKMDFYSCLVFTYVPFENEIKKKMKQVSEKEARDAKKKREKTDKALINTIKKDL